MKNVGLKPLLFLIGRWGVDMKHVSLQDPLSWTDTFELIKGSFIMWHWQGKAEVPKATSIIGCNENRAGSMYTMLYYDIRGVSRVMQMSFRNRTWKYLRLAPDFSQRFVGKVSNDETTIKGKGEVSKDNGKTWVYDFSTIYRKIV